MGAKTSRNFPTAEGSPPTPLPRRCPPPRGLVRVSDRTHLWWTTDDSVMPYHWQGDASSPCPLGEALKKAEEKRMSSNAEAAFVKAFKTHARLRTPGGPFWSQC